MKAMLNALALVLVLAMVWGAGCKKQADQNSPGGKKSAGTIAISVLTTQNPFFMEIANSVKDEAAKHGYETIIVSGELDAAKQDQQVKDFIVQKVSAIILTPCDSKAVGPAIKQANDAGIPVFTADIACLAPEAKVVTHVATDNYAGGRQAGKAMMQALGNKGNVAIIGHPGLESGILRTKGFKDELAEAKSPIKIVTELSSRGMKDESFTVTQDILNSHQDLNGIFAINDPTALGSIAAIEKAKKSGQIMIVGFDGQLDGKKAILEGKIFADPIQFPDQIGRKTVQAIMSYLEGAKPDPKILIPTSLYYKADAEKDPQLKGK